MSLVTDHLNARGVAFELIPHLKAFTSIDEARALGITADEVVKSLVLRTDSGYALVVIPGSRRLDMHLARDAIGAGHTRFATEEELGRDFGDYELGALPPLGSLLGLRAFVDPEVKTHDTVVFAAGTQTESVKVTTEDLLRDEPATVIPLTRGSGGDEEEPSA